MSDETSNKADSAPHGDKVANTEVGTEVGNNIEPIPAPEAKEPKEPKRTVSFNRDVHVKRFGKARERGLSSEHQSSLRKEPFTHLSERELIEEANKVIAQAQSVTCTADNPPEKFFSLPHRRKLREDKTGRRNSDDAISPEESTKTPLGRSTSDVTSRKRKERTSLSTLFRRQQRTRSPDAPVVVTTKPVAVVKRSKSDVTDLKSNTNLNKSKPIRKRSGSETEEFLKSLRNKKIQLSPIIESSPREDYFKKTSPFDVLQHQQLSDKESWKSNPEQKSKDLKRVNPIEKPPRFTTSDNQDPKPQTRIKRAKSADAAKENSPPISETPKQKVKVKKTVLVDKIDSHKNDDVQTKIKDSIRKIEENVYGGKDMVHSSQQPPEKPPLTRGQTVDQLVKILKEDQRSSPPRPHLLSSTNGSNINQPFSYTKPSTSLDPNLFVRTNSPEKAPSPSNKMTAKGVVYAQVMKDHDDIRNNIKQTNYKQYSSIRDNLGNFSDEDEGLGYEERHKYLGKRVLQYDYKNNDDTVHYNVNESPIRPKLREYNMTSFDEFEPTYANDQVDSDIKDPINTYRGRADGMDTKKKTLEPESKLDLDFNELSHRRQLLESRLNARRYAREQVVNNIEPLSRLITENDPIYEAEKRMKQTEKYVNDTVKYYRNTLERDGYESTLIDGYKYHGADNHNIKHTENSLFQQLPKGEIDRREFLDSLERTSRFDKVRKIFPPEPEYEPPSLESNPGKPVSPDEYKEKKYKVRKHFNSSHELLHSGQKYKVKDDVFGKRKGHYSSNPEIAQEREEEYANLRYNPKHESYHNSLRRMKGTEKDYRGYNSVRRYDSGDSRDYYREQISPRRNDFDSRLVDSGIENDFRLNSSGELNKSRYRHESDDDVQNTSLFLANEKQYAEDSYADEQIYANGEYMAKFKDHKAHTKEFGRRDPEERSHPQLESYQKSQSKHDDKVSAKPPKAKKLSGLEKVKQLFSRDSSKKSKKEKEKEAVQEKNRTRVLKSPEHLARHDSDYRRYTDPEPSDIEVRSGDDPEERKHRRSREDLNRYRNTSRCDGESPLPPVDRRDEGDRESEYEDRFEIPHQKSVDRLDLSGAERGLNERGRGRRPSEREDAPGGWRAARGGPLDSPALADRYRERRRLATPSPSPSPPRAHRASRDPVDQLRRRPRDNIKVRLTYVVPSTPSCVFGLT
ncbi:uncharacterized protein LOC126967494 [Leptidea sinapis]|uniref:uncharacterized protein LOC126967494 n=1 Tax=Leptidea sinapis TaxID=189913 RepID=UPI0021C38566|nr:uncharacterized protein LOC126967494 [Leptidea sinapis]